MKRCTEESQQEGTKTRNRRTASMHSQTIDARYTPLRNLFFVFCLFFQIFSYVSVKMDVWRCSFALWPSVCVGVCVSDNLFNHTSLIPHPTDHSFIVCDISRQPEECLSPIPSNLLLFSPFLHAIAPQKSPCGGPTAPHFLLTLDELGIVWPTVASQ